MAQLKCHNASSICWQFGEHRRFAAGCDQENTCDTIDLLIIVIEIWDGKLQRLEIDWFSLSCDEFEEVDDISKKLHSCLTIRTLINQPKILHIWENFHLNFQNISFKLICLLYTTSDLITDFRKTLNFHNFPRKLPRCCLIIDLGWVRKKFLKRFIDHGKVSQLPEVELSTFNRLFTVSAWKYPKCFRLHDVK